MNRVVNAGTLRKRHRAAALHDAGATVCVPLLPRGRGVRQPYAAFTSTHWQTNLDPNQESASSSRKAGRLPVEICILAGGSSQRMGRDKSRLRLGSTTMPGYIRNTARATGLPVRVIRRDSTSKCGPLGGTYTALKTTKAYAVLFLACDMPLVSAELIEFVLRQFGVFSPLPKSAIFVHSRGVGFPFVLGAETLDTVERQIEKGDFSLQSLAKILKAPVLRLRSTLSRQLFNVNTPADWAVAKRRLANRRGVVDKPMACI